MEVVLDFIKVIGGFMVGGWFVPWYKYFLENKKQKRNDRIKLLSEIRSYLESGYPTSQSFLATPMFNKIQEYISEELSDTLRSFHKRGNAHTYPAYEGYHEDLKEIRNRFHDELNSIEKKWKLNL